MNKKKSLDLQTKIEFEFIENEWIISAFFSKETAKDFCIALCLIKEKLVDNIVLACEENKCKITIEQDNSIDLCKRANTKKVNIKFLSIQLSANEIDYWRVFFLKNFRDDQAEVSHIDVEIKSQDERIPLVNFMLEFEKVKPGLSPSEFNKILKELD